LFLLIGGSYYSLRYTDTLIKKRLKNGWRNSMTEKEKALNGLIWFVNRMCQISDRYGINQNKRTLFSYMKNYVDFKKMNAQDFIDIGFAWSSDEKRFMLCPLYLADVFFQDKDHDTRGGYIAYGFNVINGEIDWNEGGIV
jgi:hypothetical protein